MVRKHDLTQQFFGDSDTPCIAAIVGGGGKSALMYTAAGELAAQGSRVLVTTTTHIYHPGILKRPHHRLIIGGAGELHRFGPGEKGLITVAAPGTAAEGKKLAGFNEDEIEEISHSGQFDHILIEADGAGGRPVKAPNPGEPVIPPCTDLVIGVIGLDCLEQVVSKDWVFRMESFCRITNARPGGIIDEEHLLRLILSREGLFKDTPDRCRRILILNKCENLKQKESADKIAILLEKEAWPHSVFATVLEGEYSVRDMRDKGVF